MYHPKLYMIMTPILQADPQADQGEKRNARKKAESHHLQQNLNKRKKLNQIKM